MGSEEKYVVLRDLQRGRLTDPFSFDLRGPVRSAGVGPIVLAEPRVDVESTDIRGRNELARDPEVVGVTAAMPIRLVEPRDTGAQGEEGDSWGVAAVGAVGSRYTGAGVPVAVLDTGIDAGHPSFAGIDLLCEDFTGRGAGDVNGHGTHCAGTIFGRDVDRSRIGIAKGVDRAFIGKVLNDDGSGSSEMAFRGLQWAADRGAKVISLSLGFDFPGMVRQRVKNGWPADLATSVALEAYRGNLRMFDALMAMVRAREAFGPGCVVVAAAGNESMRDVNPNYQIAASLPAAADGVVSVGALARTESGYGLAPFSNSFPTLCAPGVAIKSALSGGGLRTMSGTSMACPHVAGVAALWWEAAREGGLPANAATVVARLLSACSTDRLAPGLGDSDRGVGMVAAP
jgi:subtilisin family serine protease